MGTICVVCCDIKELYFILSRYTLYVASSQKLVQEQSSSFAMQDLVRATQDPKYTTQGKQSSNIFQSRQVHIINQQPLRYVNLSLLSIRRVTNPRSSFACVFVAVSVQVCSFASFFPVHFFLPFVNLLHSDNHQLYTYNLECCCTYVCHLFFYTFFLALLHHLLHSHKILRHYQRYILECYCTYVSHLSFYMFFIALLHLYKFLCNYQRYNLECCYTCVCHLSFYMFFLVLLHRHFEMESMFQYSSCMCSLECSCIFCGTL